MKKLIVIGLMIVSANCWSQSTDVSFKLKHAEDVHVELFRMYVSNISLEFSDGTHFSEANSYHLLDREQPNSLGFSIEHGTEKSVVAINMTIGTDSLINVSGALDGDLDPIKGMYWAWNTGYINFKLEGTKDKKAISYHVGGYANPHPTARAIRFNIKKTKSINFLIDLDKFISSALSKELVDVMIPGEEATFLADTYKGIIGIE